MRGRWGRVGTLYANDEVELMVLKWVTGLGQYLVVLWLSPLRMEITHPAPHHLILCFILRRPSSGREPLSGPSVLGIASLIW